MGRGDPCTQCLEKEAPEMAELQHKFVDTNGIRMHYVEQGNGPLVVLCHGWPESWDSQTCS